MVDMQYRYGYCLDDASFAKLYNKVESATFDDNKFDLLEMASLGCYYSCEQTARVMRLFSFGDKQLKVLSMMAPRIVDPQSGISAIKKEYFLFVLHSICIIFAITKTFAF